MEKPTELPPADELVNSCRLRRARELDNEKEAIMKLQKPILIDIITTLAEQNYGSTIVSTSYDNPLKVGALLAFHPSFVHYLQSLKYTCENVTSTYFSNCLGSFTKHMGDRSSEYDYPTQNKSYVRITWDATLNLGFAPMHMYALHSSRM